MNRAIVNFWLFFATTTIGGGLLGRYIAALVRGYGSAEIIVMALLLAVMAGFSVTVLLRIVRAMSGVRRLQAAYNYSRVEIPREE